MKIKDCIKHPDRVRGVWNDNNLQTLMLIGSFKTDLDEDICGIIYITRGESRKDVKKFFRHLVKSAKGERPMLQFWLPLDRIHTNAMFLDYKEMDWDPTDETDEYSFYIRALFDIVGMFDLLKQRRAQNVLA